MGRQRDENPTTLMTPRRLANMMYNAAGDVLRAAHRLRAHAPYVGDSSLKDLAEAFESLTAELAEIEGRVRTGAMPIIAGRDDQVVEQYPLLEREANGRLTDGQLDKILDEAFPGGRRGPREEVETVVLPSPIWPEDHWRYQGIEVLALPTWLENWLRDTNRLLVYEVFDLEPRRSAGDNEIDPWPSMWSDGKTEEAVTLIDFALDRLAAQWRREDDAPVRTPGPERVEAMLSVGPAALLERVDHAEANGTSTTAEWKAAKRAEKRAAKKPKAPRKGVAGV